MEEKMNKRQQQAAQTEKRLLKAGMRLFEEKGYENTKISDICKEAGVSSGNFYHYFPSKDHMFLAMFASFDNFAEQVLSKKNYSSHIDAIRDLLTCQVTATQRKNPAIQAQLCQAQLNTHGGYVVAESRFIHAYVKDLLRKGIEAGEIDPSHDIERTARFLFQVPRGILFDWAMRDGTFSKEEQINLALDLILPSLARPKPPAVEGLPEIDFETWQENYYKEQGWV